MPDVGTTTQPVPEASAAYRATVVAGIRALANLIQNNTNLPVPQHVAAQYSVLGHTTADRIDITRAAAAELGVEADIDDETSVATLTIAAGGYPTNLPMFVVTYTVHGSTSHDRETTGGAE